MSYKDKYLKYKKKYLEYKKYIGGVKFKTFNIDNITEETKIKLKEFLAENYDFIKFEFIDNILQIIYKYGTDEKFNEISSKIQKIIKDFNSKNVENINQNSTSNVCKENIDIKPYIDKLDNMKPKELSKFFKTIDPNIHKTIVDNINYKYNNLDKLIRDTNHDKLIDFLNQMNNEQLFSYLNTNLNILDHNKSPLYFIARQGRLDAIQNIINRLSDEQKKSLGSKITDDNRTLLFGAVDAVGYDQKVLYYIYISIKNIVPQHLINNKMIHIYNEKIIESNLKEWFYMRNHDLDNNREMIKKELDILFIEPISQEVISICKH